MEKIYDMIVIGGGPAGYTAALYAARASFDVLVLEHMSVGGQMALTDIIDNYPGFEEGIDGITLGMKMQQCAERFGAQSAYGDVTDVDLSSPIKVLTCSDLSQYQTKTVVIATGASPKPLGLLNEERFLGRGIHYCAHCDGRFYKNKKVLVIGGGNSAVADALYLSHLCQEVVLVHRRDTLRATKIYHEPLMQAENVQFCWNSQVDAFLADERITGVRVRNVITNEMTEIHCDGVFVSIGRMPAGKIFAHQLALDPYGYIIADESTKTNIPGVYAVGDVRTKALRQVVTAVADGAVAAHYAEEYLSTLL